MHSGDSKEERERRGKSGKGGEETVFQRGQLSD